MVYNNENTMDIDDPNKNFKTLQATIDHKKRDLSPLPNNAFDTQKESSVSRRRENESRLRANNASV